MTGGMMEQIDSQSVNDFESAATGAICPSCGTWDTWYTGHICPPDQMRPAPEYGELAAVTNYMRVIAAKLDKLISLLEDGSRNPD